MPIQHVRQKHEFGCSIACVAMVTGLPYDTVMKDVGGYRDRGFDHFQWSEILAQYGYAVQFLFRYRQNPNGPRAKWPLAPWADTHILQTRAHAIVMDADGHILDPAHPPTVKRTIADYDPASIVSMVGIFKVDRCVMSTQDVMEAA